MKNNLYNGNYKLNSKQEKIVFDYKHYIKACMMIAKDIKKKYDLKNGDIELIGMARGALPMLVTMSHFLGIRKVSVIQTQMSNSDECYDYGKFRYISDNIDKNKTKCILFEDIIYKGTTTEGVIKILKERKKDILGVYALVIDEGFKEIKDNEIELNYVYEVGKDKWVYFLWETDINKI